MFVIIGCIVVIGAVLGGFTWAGGHVEALIHPSEIVTIGGAALGAMIVMSPTKVLKDLMKGILGSLKGSPFNKAAYEELFKCMYHLLRTARRDGLLALESHVGNPHESDIFHKYPGIHKNHHVTEFICGALSPIIEGAIPPERVPELLETELKALEEEHHAPLDVLGKTADGLPGFGIVAAVLGIVITMGHIGGPVEEIGHKVGAALVGTFLGILASYGFLAPLNTRLDFLGRAEMSYFKAIAAIVEGFVHNLPPKVAVDQARRGLPSEFRPSRERVEELFKEVESA